MKDSLQKMIESFDKPLPWYRRVGIWLSMVLTAFSDWMHAGEYAIARWLFWLGAKQERKRFEQMREEYQKEIAAALVDALGPDAVVQTETSDGKKITVSGAGIGAGITSKDYLS